MVGTWWDKPYKLPWSLIGFFLPHYHIRWWSISVDFDGWTGWSTAGTKTHGDGSQGRIELWFFWMCSCHEWFLNMSSHWSNNRHFIFLHTGSFFLFKILLHGSTDIARIRIAIFSHCFFVNTWSIARHFFTLALITIWLWLTVRHGTSPFLVGKPSISMGHLYHGYVSHNQREQKKQ